MKAVIFTRVSSERQEDGHSLNAQLKRLQEYCDRRGFTVIKELEASESSTIGDRKKFHIMIDFIKSEHKKIKSRIALVVDSVDRLQRSFKECPLIDDLMQANIVEVHFYKENFFLSKDSSSTDILRWDMSVLFAKSYVSALSESVRRGNKYAWEKGLWTGKPPIGYKKGEGKNSFVHDDLRAYYIKQIFELYATELHSLMSLERKCKEWNLTSNKSLTGRPICKNTIDGILKDPFYYGEMYIEKYDKYYKHNYKPIIERWLFEKCKSITEKRCEQGNKAKSPQITKKKFIFSDLVTCRVTSRKVSCYGGNNKYLYTWDAVDPINNTKVSVPEEEVLEKVKEVFKSISIRNEKLLNEMTEYLQSSNKAETEYHKMIMEQLNKRVLEIDEEENRLIKMMMKQSITDDKFDKMNKELEKEKYELNIKREQHQKADKSAKTHIITAFQLITNAYKLFEVSKIEEKNQLLRFVFSKLELEGRNLHYTLRKPFNVLVNLNEHPSWRRRGDSNPRYSFPYTFLAGKRFQPLSHFSIHKRLDVGRLKINKIYYFIFSFF
jgi:site-specific DNA recombinase